MAESNRLGAASCRNQVAKEGKFAVKETIPQITASLIRTDIFLRCIHWAHPWKPSSVVGGGEAAAPKRMIGLGCRRCILDLDGHLNMSRKTGVKNRECSYVVSPLAEVREMDESVQDRGPSFGHCGSIRCL